MIKRNDLESKYLETITKEYNILEVQCYCESAGSDGRMFRRLMRLLSRHDRLAIVESATPAT
jgi:hypothetical protein